MPLAGVTVLPEKPSITITPSIIQRTAGMARNLTFLAVLILLSGCAGTLPPIHFDHNDIRTIDVIIGTDGTHDENEIMGLFEQFNGESVYETGIVLNPIDIIHFDMSEQRQIWPACREVVPCWADYVYLNGYKYDIAIYFTRINPIVYILGGVVGEIDATKLRYIALYNLSYWNFKHHVCHVFHAGHSSSGVMFPLESFSFIPVASSNLSEESRREVLKNKWRVFEGITVEQVEEMKR